MVTFLESVFQIENRFFITSFVLSLVTAILLIVAVHRDLSMSFNTLKYDLCAIMCAGSPWISFGLPIVRTERFEVGFLVVTIVFCAFGIILYQNLDFCTEVSASLSVMAYGYPMVVISVILFSIALKAQGASDDATTSNCSALLMMAGFPYC